MSLNDRSDSIAKDSPSSLLPPVSKRSFFKRKPREELPKQSPESLLPKDSTKRESGQERDDVVAVSPTSLLPEAPTDPHPGRVRDELATVELLPPPLPAPKRFRINWKILAGVGAALSVVVLAIFLVSHANKKSAPELLQEAIVSRSSGQPIAALIHAKNALQVDPNFIDARMIHGSLLLETGDFSAAEGEFRLALELGAKREIALPMIGKALIARKKYQEALDAMAAAPDEDPTKQPPELLAQRGHALFFRISRRICG